MQFGQWLCCVSGNFEVLLSFLKSKFYLISQILAHQQQKNKNKKTSQTDQIKLIHRGEAGRDEQTNLCRKVSPNLTVMYCITHKLQSRYVFIDSQTQRSADDLCKLSVSSFPVQTFTDVGKRGQCAADYALRESRKSLLLKLSFLKLTAFCRVHSCLKMFQCG